jgi:hypothetical protein
MIAAADISQADRTFRLSDRTKADLFRAFSPRRFWRIDFLHIALPAGLFVDNQLSVRVGR